MSGTVDADRDQELEIELPPVGGSPISDGVSFAEEHLWSTDHARLSAIPFLNCRPNMSMVARLENALDREALSASLSEIVSRHEVLRSTFCTTGGRLERRYDPSSRATVTDVDLRSVREGDRTTRLQRTLAELSEQPFDLASPPLIRTALVRLRDDEAVMAIVVPHIVFDRWSKRVLAQELTALYAGHVAGLTPTIEPLPVQYRDYVRWQRERLAGSRGRALVGYWSDRLATPSDVRLPTDGNRQQAPSRRSGNWSFTIPAHDVARLAAVSRRLRVTMATLMLAIVRTFIHLVGGEGDLAIGVPLTDRRRREFEPLIGLFMNVVIVRSAAVDAMKFADLLDGVRQALLDASRHQDMQYGYLLRILPTTTPPYRILFSFMPGLSESVAQLPGLRVTPLWVDSDEPSDVDLAVQMITISKGIVCRLLYKADLFSPARVRGFAEQLQSVIRVVPDGPETPIGTLRPKGWHA